MNAASPMQMPLTSPAGVSRWRPAIGEPRRSNRRRARRFAVCWPVQIRRTDTGQVYSAYCRDISACGLGITFESSPRPGLAGVTVDMTVSTMFGPVTARGEIRWTANNGAGIRVLGLTDPWVDSIVMASLRC